MNRRLLGMLVLLGVAIAVAMVPTASGRRMAGEATLSPVPAPPEVGECLAESALVTASGMDGQSSEGEMFTLVGPKPTDPPFVACGVGRHREVAAVSSLVGSASERGALPDGFGGGCRNNALEYAGLVATATGREHTMPGVEGEPVVWGLSIAVDARWVILSRSWRSVGKGWAACVVAMTNWKGYPGSLRDAFINGDLPHEFGTCWRSGQLSAGVAYVDCGIAHQSELIATAFVPTAAIVNFDVLIASCNRMASRVIGRSDPTLGGQINVVTSPGEDRWTTSSRRSSTVICYVTSAGERQLDGSLIGLRARPVPWAG